MFNYFNIIVAVPLVYSYAYNQPYHQQLLGMLPGLYISKPKNSKFKVYMLYTGVEAILHAMVITYFTNFIYGESFATAG